MSQRADMKQQAERELGALLGHLIVLEYDTQAAFEAAAARLGRSAYREQLREFLADQQRHIVDLKAMAARISDAVPSGPDAKQMLVRGLLMVANLAGDRAILYALGGTLDEMNVAYERAITHHAATPEVLAVLQRHFMDERRHRSWLTRCLHPDDAAMEALLGEQAELEAEASLMDPSMVSPGGRHAHHPVNFQPQRH
jgi:hypothetical protein